MKTLTKVAIGSLAAALMLAVSPFAFAHSKDKGDDNGFRFGSFIKAHLDVNDDGKISKDEREKADLAELRTHLNIGTVTAINGSTFTIDPKGPKSTTTVTTNASTVFTAKGAATTSSALKVGSKVFLVGTTTASSTTGDSFTASVVNIFAKGFGHMRGWFHLGFWR